MRKFFRRQEVQAVCSKTDSVTSMVGAETTLKRTGEAKILKSSNLTVLMTILALVMVFGFNATAQTIIDQGYCGYGGGTNLTWVLTELGGDTTLTISGSGAMADYHGGNMPWYNYLNTIKTIAIGDSVTTIGNYAFFNCSNLVFVTIGNSVTNMGDYTFNNCSRLRTLNIPNSVTSIGYTAFYRCGFTTITIPNSVTTIGYYAFAFCRDLTSVTIGNGVDTIEDGAFASCNNLSFLTVHAVTPPILEGGSNVFRSVSDTIPVYIPCGTYNGYSNDPDWSYFSNFIEFTNVDTTFVFDTICYGEIYNDYGFNISEGDGIYYNTLQNVGDCDSVVVCLTLTEYPFVPITTYSDTICSGEIYNDANFTNLTKDSIYYNTLQNINGCDSVIELTLTVNLPDTTLLFDSIQQGETYNKNGFSVSEAGIYTQELQNVYGCDSVVVLHLAITGVGIVRTRHALPLQVYPNPVNEQLTIKNEELRENSVVEIYDVVGQCVYQINKSTNNQINNEISIDISHLSSGMYFLKVDNKVVKFVKE